MSRKAIDSGHQKIEQDEVEWPDVDRAAGVIRLRPEVSETREGRVLVLSGRFST